MDIVQAIKTVLTWICKPEPYFFIMSALCLLSVWKPGAWVKPRVFWPIMMGLVALYIFSIFDPNFRYIAFKGDNIPIILMLFLLVFFTWVGFYRGWQNDERRARGEILIEEEDKEVKVLVWPHLLYIEFIVGIFVLAFLLVWSIGIPAPLEEPASAARTPNPSKAPWYFLGLQEMLVYFDPWMAGVVAPSLIIVGLMALPYLDKNPKGNGYYTIKERKFAIGGFCFGFLVLWIALIFLGTVLRGPNWNFFGPFDYWDPHKQPVLNNLNLSEIIFIQWFNEGLPNHWLKREAIGIVLTLGYIFVLPAMLHRLPKCGSFFAKMRGDMGDVRYFTFAFLFLSMLSVPIKMILRWTLNLKYIVAIPEYFFNV